MARPTMQGARNRLPLKFTSKADLVAALEARRGWARRTDKKRLAEHAKREKEYLATFRAACKDALTWDWDEAKERSFTIKPPHKYDDYGSWGDRPECPQSREVHIDEALAMLALTEQEQFTLYDGDYHFGRIYYLLTHDDDIKAAMC